MSVRRFTLPALLVLSALLLPPAAARAQQKQLGVGFLVSELPIGPYQRFGFIQGLARQISRATGLPARGYAYQTEGNLLHDIKAKKIQYAVVGGFLLATYRKVRVLSSGKLAGRYAVGWSLMGKKKVSVTALRSKILLLPGIGRVVRRLVENGLLGGYLRVNKHFKVRRAPGLASAREAVQFNKAQATFAPINSRGLVQLVQRSIPAPPPGFVLIDNNQPPARVKKVVAALKRFRDTTGSIVGWGPPRNAAYQQIARLARKQPMRMVMLPSETLRTRAGGFVKADRGQELELPALDELYLLP